jgi:hypothetical protein
MVGDLHRSAGMFVIVSLAGMALLHRHAAGLTAKLLPTTAVLGLILPAAHVITVWEYPIHGVFYELNQSATRLLRMQQPENDSYKSTSSD